MNLILFFGIVYCLKFFVGLFIVVMVIIILNNNNSIEVTN